MKRLQSMKDEFAGCAWVHRKGKPSMFFQPNALMRLAHVTKFGTLYIIFDDLKNGKPFWIGRFVDGGKNGKNSFITWEHELRARSIEFAYNGEYFF